jgi:hypothetical protein
LAARSENSTTFSNLGFSFLLAFAIGLTVSILDALSTKINAKVINAAAIAIPASIVLGLALGTIANFFYSNTMQDLYSQAIEKVSSGESEESVMNWLSSSTHFPRGIAWLICGIAAGLTVGVASKSMKRTGLTTGGGALGGFLGGFIFDFFPADLEWVSQMLGICLTGMLIGSSMALLEQAARTVYSLQERHIYWIITNSRYNTHQRCCSCAFACSNLLSRGKNNTRKLESWIALLSGRHCGHAVLFSRYLNNHTGINSNKI